MYRIRALGRPAAAVISIALLPLLLPLLLPFQSVDRQWLPVRTAADELVSDGFAPRLEIAATDVRAAPVNAAIDGDERRLLDEHQQDPHAGDGLGNQHEGGQPSDEQSHTHGAGEEYFSGEHHHVATPVDLAISSMLLGCVVFIMMLFYLVNYSDDDIKYYAWSVISCTISIFTAIFLFEALDEVLDQIMRYKHLSPVHRAFLDYGVLLFWLLLIQIVIMANVGVICVKDSGDLALNGGTERTHSRGANVGMDFKRIDSHVEREDQKVNTKSWAMLFAHMSGFASIFAAGTWQHLEQVKCRPVLVLAIVPVHLCIMYSLFLLAAQFRRCFKKQHLHTTMQHLWDEETEESENDVASLSLSFLLVQGLRYQFTGDMPARDGIEELPAVQHWQAILELLLCALAFAALTLGLVQAKGAGVGTRVHRMLSILEGVCSMAFAWSLFFTSKWELKRLMPDWDPNTMMPRTVLALSLSGVCCALIFVFDYLVDLEETDDSVDEAIKKIISGLSLLVGFAWEQSFEGATHNLASVSHNPVTMKVVLALAVVVIVVPAWRWYILVKVSKVEAEHGAAMCTRRTIRASLRCSVGPEASAPRVTWRSPVEADKLSPAPTKSTSAYEVLEQESTERTDSSMDPFIAPDT